jgi:NAD(P)-dependent dehydrogenase (short-subunit alcohol dehydrogenase family)
LVNPSLKNLEPLGANIFSYHRSGEGKNHLDVTEKFENIDGLPDVIDGLVYCPGSINLKPFHRFSIEDFQKDYEINVLGAVKVLQACLKALKNPNPLRSFFLVP